MRLRVTVPATSANLGSGFDCLAMALDLRNEVEAALSDRPRVEVAGEGEDVLPRDERNTVYRAAEAVAARAGVRDVAFAFRCFNRIPLDRGLGSSAAARVAGIAAANRLLGSPLSPADLVRLSAELEGHPDNVVAAWVGGVTVAVRDGEGGVCWQRILPDRFPSVVLCVPELRVPTGEARARLPAQVSLQDAVFNTGRAALLVAALYNGDFGALAVATQDRLHQPYRELLVPGFADAVAAAREAGAWGAALSGAGSSLVAFCPAECAESVGEAMRTALARYGVHSRWRVSSVDVRGTVVEDAPGGETWDG
ncbi:MAG: homoserine kinase [Armatimonadota bacterium]|nr:homoserine kinase [Armatimonadota bacterium]